MNIVENPLAGSSDSTLVETPQTAGHLTTTHTRFASKPKTRRRAAHVGHRVLFCGYPAVVALPLRERAAAIRLISSYCYGCDVIYSTGWALLRSGTTGSARLAGTC